MLDSHAFSLPEAGATVSENDRKAALALIEAAFPSMGRIRGADESTLNGILETLDEAHPGLRTFWLKTARSFDWLAVRYHGKRFHRLERVRQDSLLARWEQDPLLRTVLLAFLVPGKLVHFDRDEVYTAMGGHRNAVVKLEQPTWLAQVKVGEAVPSDLECEVVVVGTGAGGAVVGKELAERGRAVLFVEEGQHHRRDAFTGSSMKAHRDFYRPAFSVGNNIFPVFVGRMVGGSTAVNGGTSFRTPDWVLHNWCEATGSEAFSPSALAPHFDKVEATLGVAPADRRFIGAIQDIFQRGCDAFGWSHFVIRRNAPGCEGSGFCDFGCRTDARQSTNLSYLPLALGRGAECVTELVAESVWIEAGRAVGVLCRSRTGAIVRIRAEAVILSGGALPTPHLLHKQGIANSSGQLGKGLTLHPSTGVSALFDDDIRGYAKIPQAYGCDEFLRDGLLISAAQPDFNYAPLLFPAFGSRLVGKLNQLDHIASFGLLASDATQGRILRRERGVDLLYYNLNDEDLRRLHRGAVAIGDMCWAAGAKAIYPGVLGQAPIETQKAWKAFCAEPVAAKDWMVTSYHPLGTARMRSDPTRGVVDLNHESHDVKRMFIVDGSCVEGPIGVNPQITIMAMATRAAACIDTLLG